MKNAILVLVAILFTSALSFAQYTDKDKKEVKNKTVADSNRVTTPLNTPSNQTVYVYMPNKKSVDIDLTDDSDPNQYDQTKKIKDPKMSDFYPVSQYEGYLGYVSLQNPVFKVKGGNLYAVVRQNPNILDKGSLSRKTYGLYAEVGRYDIDMTNVDLSSANMRIQQYGAGISFAMTRKRPGFNALVLNLGVRQEIEDGNSGLFTWRQIDWFLYFSGWIDLTRNERNTFFSRSNLSFHWNRPVSTRGSALWNGEVAERQNWDKENCGLEYQQTMLMFYVGERTGVHFGVNLGYEHYSANMQDWYAPGVFLELHGKHYKIAQLMYTQNMRSNGHSKRDSYGTIRLSVDVVQLARNVFDLKF